MALVHTPPGDLGMQPPEFTLNGVDGKTHPLTSFLQGKGLLIVFMCNHCPYVKAVLGRINQLAEKFHGLGIPVVGINPNDAAKYPEDSLPKMIELSREAGFAFAYLHDPTQAVAKSYGAVCTPDFFLFRRKDPAGSKATGTQSSVAQAFELCYRGRLDDSWKDETKVTTRDLEQAMSAIVEGRPQASQQTPSMGCSIKWLPS